VCFWRYYLCRQYRSFPAPAAFPNLIRSVRPAAGYSFAAKGKMASMGGFDMGLAGLPANAFASITMDGDEYVRCSKCGYGGCDVRISSCGCVAHSVSFSTETRTRDASIGRIRRSRQAHLRRCESALSTVGDFSTTRHENADRGLFRGPCADR
jgi:hypothetical protein